MDAIPVDRINNHSQKESALDKAGLTRFKYMQKIALALEAVKMVKSKSPNESGQYDMVEEPDWEQVKWAVEMLAKLKGDMIERKEIEYDVGDKTLERFKSMSVADLKAEAARLIAGRPTERLPKIEP